MSGKKTIQTDAAPAANALFSQGVQAGGFIFTTQVGLLPSGQIVSERVEEQTRQCLENIRAVLVAERGNLSDVVQVTVYLTDLDDAPAMNEIYALFFPQDPPSRTCVQVAALAPGVKVEMQAVAYLLAASR